MHRAFLPPLTVIHTIYPAGGMDAATQLTQLRQGNRPASDYAIQFRTLAAKKGV